MARFTLPRDIYHGEGALEELKNLKGKKAIRCCRWRRNETPGIPCIKLKTT